MPSVNELLVQISASTEKLRMEMQRAEAEVAARASGIEKAAGAAEKALGLLETAFKFTEAYIGLETIKEVGKELFNIADAAERASARITAQLKATGNAAGLTKGQIEEAIDNVASGTRASVDDVRTASSELLAFRNVAGENFTRVLKLAQDLSAAGFGPLTENVIRLGRASEDPEQGMNRMARAGIAFSATLKQQVKDLAEHGDKLGAWEKILDEVQARVGGTGAADASTLSGAIHKTWVEMETWIARTIEQTGALKAMADVLDRIAAHAHESNAAAAEGPAHLAMLNAQREFADAISAAAAEDPTLAALQRSDASGAGLALGQSTKDRIDSAAKLIAKLKDQVAAEDMVTKAEAMVAKGGHFNAQVNQTVADGTDKLTKAKKVLADQAAADAVAAEKERIAAQKRNEDALDQSSFEAHAAEVLRDATMQGAQATDQANLQIEIETALRKQAAGATDEDTAALIDNITAKHNAKRETEDYTEALKAQQERAKKAAEDAQRQAEEQAKAIQKFSQETGAHVVDAFINMAEGSKKPFDNLLQYAKHTFEQMAAAALLNPVIIPVITSAINGMVSTIGMSAGGSMVPGGAAGALGGFGGSAVAGGLGASAAAWLNGLGANAGLTGASAAGNGFMVGSIPGLGGTGAPLTGATSGMLGPMSLTSLLSAGALGGLGGYVLGGLYGGNKTYGAIGGAGGAMIGAEIGSIVPGIGTVIGGIAGGLIGSLASLLGPGPSDKLQGDYVNFGSNSLSNYGYTGSKYSAQNAASASSLGNAVLQLGQLLSSLGGTTHFASNARIEAGSNGAPIRAWYGDINGDTSNGVFQTPQDAFKAVAAEMAKDVDGLSDHMKTALENIDFSNLDTASQQLNLVASFDKAVKSFVTGDTADQAQQQIDAIKASFQALIPQLEAVGITADEVMALQGKALAKLKDDIDQSNKDAIEQLEDPQQYELDQLEKAHQQELKDAAATGADVNLIETKYGLLRKQIVEKYAKDTTQVVQDTVDYLGNAFTAVGQRAGDAVNAQMQVLSAQSDAINQTLSLAQNIGQSIDAAKAKILGDAQLSYGSNQSRLQDALGALDQAYTAYQGGDMNAGASIGDLAVAAQQANVAFNASSAQGAAIQKHILDVLNSTKTQANSEIEVAKLNLSANQAQVDLLQKQLDILQATATASKPPAGTTSADVAALNASYNSTRSAALAAGMTEEQFANSPLFKAFQGQLLSDIAGSSDTAWLTSTLAGAQARSSDPIYGTSGATVADATAKRLHDLGIPGFEAGGVTGNLARVHAGEWLYVGPPARVMSRGETAMAGAVGGQAGAGISAEIRALHQSVVAIGEDHARLLLDHNQRLIAIESNGALAVRYRR